VEGKRSLGLELFYNIAISFACSIMAVSLTGRLGGDSVLEASGLFALGNSGLSYQTIFQFLGLSAVMGTLITLLMSDRVLKKVMLLWKFVIMWFLLLASTTSFAIVFRWFPLNLWSAWASFIISVTLGFAIGSIVMIVAVKLENKKYDKLLNDYKANQIKEEDEIK